MVFEGNIAEKWKQWKEDFKWYLIAVEADAKSEKVRAGLLLHCLGPKAKELYNNFVFAADGDNMKYTKIVEQFEAHCIGQKNVTLQRFKFFTHRQESKTFKDFSTELQTMSKECDFGNLRDSLVKDMIIIGTKDKRLQERLLRNPTIDLAVALKEGQAAEASKEHKETLNAVE